MSTTSPLSSQRLSSHIPLNLKSYLCLVPKTCEMKPFLKLIYLSALIFSFVSCEDENTTPSSSGNSGGNQANNPESIQFDPSDKPVYTQNKTYKIHISGGTPPYSVTSSDVSSAYVSNDSLIFINQLVTQPTLLGINVKDTLNQTAQFQYVASPREVSMTINNLFSAALRDSTDTAGVAFINSTIRYFPESDNLVYSTGSATAYSPLFFSVTGIKQDSLLINSFQFRENPPPVQFPVFPGYFQIDSSESQSFVINYDNLQMPEAFTFTFNLEDRDTTSQKAELTTTRMITVSY